MVNYSSNSEDIQNSKRDLDNITILTKERWRQEVEFVLKYLFVLYNR